MTALQIESDLCVGNNSTLWILAISVRDWPDCRRRRADQYAHVPTVDYEHTSSSRSWADESSALPIMAPGCSACRGRSRRTARFANRSISTAMAVTGSLAYTYQRSSDPADEQNDPRVEFAVDVSSEGRFVLRYSDKDHPREVLQLDAGSRSAGQPVVAAVRQAARAAGPHRSGTC